MSLSASSILKHAGSIRAVRRFAATYDEYLIAAETKKDCWVFVTPWGRVTAQGRGDQVDLAVHANDDTNLCYVKMMVASNLGEAPGTEAAIVWDGDGANSRVPPFLRRMHVVASRRLTPHMRRITLAGENLGRFAEGGLHLRLLIPPKGRKPVWPHLLANGLLAWPTGSDTLTARVYTIRSVDAGAGTLDIDVVVHESSDGPGARFALECEAGMEVGVLGPLGSDRVATDQCIYLGDETALPAIARLLQRRTRGSRAIVVAEVDGPGDHYPLDADRDVEIRWLYRRGRPGGTTGAQASMLREATDPCERTGLSVWAAGEFEDFRTIRRVARGEWRLPKLHHQVTTYWRRVPLAASAEPDEDT